LRVIWGVNLDFEFRGGGRRAALDRAIITRRIKKRHGGPGSRSWEPPLGRPPAIFTGGVFKIKGNRPLLIYGYLKFAQAFGLSLKSPEIYLYDWTPNMKHHIINQRRLGRCFSNVIKPGLAPVPPPPRAQRVGLSTGLASAGPDPPTATPPTPPGRRGCCRGCCGYCGCWSGGKKRRRLSAQERRGAGRARGSPRGAPRPK